MTGKAGAAARPRKPWNVWDLLPVPGGWITLGEAAHDMGISHQAVHNLVKRGTLKARRVGRKPVVLVREQDVRALPMSPQRRRELDRAASAELGDELPEG